MSMGIVGLLSLSACGGGHESGQAEPGVELEKLAVKTVKVEMREAKRLQALPGTVMPADQAVLSSRLLAEVAEADFRIGERVNEGEILVRLEAEEILAQVEQAEASLAQLQRNYARENELLTQGATTAESVRTLEDQIRVARARLSEARTMAGYTEVRAPYDGVITSKEVLRGDLVSPGTPLLTIEGIGALEVHTRVPDALSGIELGESIGIEDRGSSTMAVVTEWSPAADPQSRTRRAELTLPEGTHHRSGQYVRVLWPAEVQQQMWIPQSALVRNGQLESVFVVAEGTARLRLVQTAEARESAIEIRSGLRPGEQVVIHPTPGMQDRQPVEIQAR